MGNHAVDWIVTENGLPTYYNINYNTVIFLYGYFIKTK